MSRYAEVAVINTSIHLSDAGFPPTPAGDSTVPLTRLALSLDTRPGRAVVITDLTANVEDTDSTRSFDWQHLQHFTLLVRAQGTQAVLKQIATKCVDTLQHLEIRFEDLPRIPGLRFLMMQGPVGKLRVLDLWMKIMATLPECAPNVEVVTIAIDAGYRSFFFSIEDPQRDRALTKLPRLREVRFDIYMEHGEELRFMRFSEATKKMLHMAREAGLLSFASHRERPVDFSNHNMRYFSN
ncbi:hypothetical protein DFH06DRAFT_1142595 [Mycena polygramma]|nr:hypothetical protein DFH06DRAFT_1142595 [Mycena polygramma]